MQKMFRASMILALCVFGFLGCPAATTKNPPAEGEAVAATESQTPVVEGEEVAEGVAPEGEVFVEGEASIDGQMPEGQPVEGQPAEGGIVYVKANGTGDGRSWNAALGSIQDAVNTVSASGGGEIWVAAGTYKSTTDPVIAMAENVHIFGGFSGAEITRDARDWAVNVTIIDGENQRSCVRGTSNATLDGFTLTRGNANWGGGMYNSSASPTVTNCTFVANTTRYEEGISSAGAGMFNYSSSPTVTNCTFTANSAGSGGGMSNTADSSPVVTNCMFTSNSASAGGGMSNDGSSSPFVTNCTFAANTGGGISNSSASPKLTNCTFVMNSGSEGGAIDNLESSPVVFNCTFTANNSANSGGGIANRYFSSPTVTNCTFARNTANSFGGGMANRNSSLPIVTNCIFWGDTANSDPEIYDDGEDAAATYSCIQGATVRSGVGNINDDPLFVDGVGGSTQLREGSPCIDTGTTIAALSNDILDRPRAGAFDMGAYEGAVAQGAIVHLGIQVADSNGGSTTPGEGTYAYCSGERAFVSAQPLGKRFTGWSGDISTMSPIAMLIMTGDKTITANFVENILFVSAASTAETPTGHSWATACRTIQQGIDAAESEGGGEVWVAAGTYASLSNPVVTMKSGVSVYGGFAGAETIRDARDWLRNISTIDGEALRRCVTGANAAILDGFTVTRGMAHSANCFDGGGMYNSQSSPEVSNCIFTANTASSAGGGMYNIWSSPKVTNCTFTSNTASGMDWNNAGGGGMYNCVSSPTVINSVFISNTASANGGGVCNASNSSPVLINCTFTLNTAAAGSAAVDSINWSTPILTNCILWGDEIVELSYENAHPPQVAHSCVESFYTYGTSNIDADPLFVNASAGNVRLRDGSPCIGTATTLGAPETDIEGVTRPQGTGIDMGAYER